MSTPDHHDSEGTPVREWCGGQPVAADDLAWALAVTSSLGCGFTVRVPYGARDHEPLLAAREQAARVAELQGAELDEEPWRTLLGEPAADVPLEVTGVWEPRFRGPLGTARTRVTRRADLVRRDRVVTAVRLPWTYGSSTAVAGLPVVAGHEEAMAAAHLTQVGAGAGLWCDHRGLLSTSTAGPLLLHTADGAWQHPAPATGAVGHWLHDRLVEALGSEPTGLLADELVTPPGTPVSLWAVDACGSVTTLLGEDGPGDVRLRTLRDELLPLS